MSIVTNCTNAEESVKKKSKTTSEQTLQEADITLEDNNIVDFLKDYGSRHQENIAVIKTSFGNIKLRLYSNTPLHRAAFLYMAHENYFNDTWFYRVSEGHVIQAGNTDGIETVKKRKAIGDFTIPSEIAAGNLHKRGAVAAARSYKNNPDKRSDPFEFYITLGKSYTALQLKGFEEAYNIKLSQRQIEVYSKTGGSPHLDSEHTVFGEVIEGMDVVEKISKVRVDEGEWPLINIPVQVNIINNRTE